MIGTFPPKPGRFGRLIADAANRSVLGFAPLGVLRDVGHQTSGPAYPASLCQDCYPSLTFWPGPSGVGPFFADLPKPHRQSLAHGPAHRDLRYQRREIAVNSAAIITLIRGRSTCANSSFLALSQPPCLLALATTLSAPWPVRPRGQPSRRQPTATSFWGRPSGRAPAPCVTTCASAAELTRATARGSFPINGHPGAHPLGGRLHLRQRPGPGAPLGEHHV